ncbi:Fanconi anemia group C protein isoform X2 [Melanotaenia boesemani]|uniref:Fanconi anemia group C protein isoform X2 n=1 Tax=Melanotaenia boesemani TaxID=1250792 RepID=UPI001C050E15|nr:Fanconi anemia group C protein isoform X2 [Melanotaenia boesemani]
MTESEPASQLQQTAEPNVPLNVQEMQFWLDKSVSWGLADSPDAQKDTCLHLNRLGNFLCQLLVYINHMSSTTETLKKLPFLGQLLGRLCWNPYVTAGDTSRGLLLQCLLGLYSEHPSSAVERKANQWIQKVLCQLATEEDDFGTQTLINHMGVPAKEYHLKLLKKMVARLQENIGKTLCSQSCIDKRCSCDSILAISEVCAPLATCPEASPLIGALMQQPTTCIRETLSDDFLGALSLAHSSFGLPLEEQTKISLWYHSMPSLEEAVIGVLDSVTDIGSTPQMLERQITKSLLPKACAQHCSIFLVTNDIFRSVIKQAEENLSIKSVIHTFTKLFLRELALLQPQMTASVKAFFPQSPPNLLVPLLTMPSEMAQEAWKNHLKLLSVSLQRLTEEEEEEDRGSRSTRGHHRVFEAWFLLVQCAHWVHVAVQLLVTSGPEDCSPLLWLLTFYHHPTNKWHHRALHLEQAKEVLGQLHTLSSVLSRPLPVDRLQSSIGLLSAQPQQQSLAPSLTLDLLVNFVVFCRLPLSDSAKILQTVVDQSGLFHETACVLSSLQLRLNEASCLSDDRVHIRIKELHNTITRMQAEPTTHTHTVHNRTQP